MVWWLSNNVTQNIWFEIKALLSPSRGKHGNFIHFLYPKIEQFNGMYISSTLHISLMFKLNSIEQKFLYYTNDLLSRSYYLPLINQ